MSQIEQLRFLKNSQVEELAKKFGTPVTVFSEKVLKEQAQTALKFPSPFGTTRVSYAMKANSNPEVIRILYAEGIGIDASSGFEAQRAIKYGVTPSEITLTSQELPENLKETVEQGVQYNACSLHQLESYGKLFRGTDISIRVNTGLGEGFNNRLNTGGPSASFGIWHEHIDQVKEICSKYDLRVTRLLNHIGTGGDAKLWQKVAVMGLDVIRRLPTVQTFNIGGGFSVAYMQNDTGADLDEIGKYVGNELVKFADDTKRKINLEIEPGRFLVARAGSLISKIQDIVDTGEEGYAFLKLNSGMTEIIRPAMYGSRHPIIVVGTAKDDYKKYVVVGHCCETSDTLTTVYRDPEAIEPRLLKQASIGDLAVIEMVGAYCNYFSNRNYNSFPRSPEVMLSEKGEYKLVTRRETFGEMLSLETSL